MYEYSAKYGNLCTNIRLNTVIPDIAECSTCIVSECRLGKWS